MLISELAGPYKGRRWRTKKTQTPSWSERAAIRAFYKACPAGHHVDHIIPLSGKTAEGYSVSGVHILANLQYLPIVENLTKYNRISA